MNNRRQRQLIVGSILLFASAVFAVHVFTKPKVKDAKDLSVISGPISSYSFQDGRRGSHHYVIRLFEYQATFQIPADFVGCFAKAHFESDLKRGDLLWVSVPKESEKNLASDERLFIFSARTKGTTYLDEQDTLRIYNSDFPILMSILFFLIGSALIIWRPKDTPNTGLEPTATAP